MTGLKILGGILLVCCLLALIRVGGLVEYSVEGLHAWVRVGGFHISVFPRKRKKKRKEKRSKGKKESENKEPSEPEPQEEKPGKESSEPEPQEEKSEEEKKSEEEESTPKSGGPFQRVKRFLPLIGEAAGTLKRRIRIDDLEILFTAGGRNAARTAMVFGYSNLAVGIIWPIFAHNFEIKDYRVRTAVDFTAQSSTVWIRAALSLRIGQMVSFAVIYGIKFFRAYLAGKHPEKARKG